LQGTDRPTPQLLLFNIHRVSPALLPLCCPFVAVALALALARPAVLLLLLLLLLSLHQYLFPIPCKQVIKWTPPVVPNIISLLHLVCIHCKEGVGIMPAPINLRPLITAPAAAAAAATCIGCCIPFICYVKKARVVIQILLAKACCCFCRVRCSSDSCSLAAAAAAAAGCCCCTSCFLLCLRRISFKLLPTNGVLQLRQAGGSRQQQARVMLHSYMKGKSQAPVIIVNFRPQRHEGCDGCYHHRP